METPAFERTTDKSGNETVHGFLRWRAGSGVKFHFCTFGINRWIVLVVW